ncbi:MAG: hypothetical protein RL166_899 [Actinomycetota bacterium]
MSKSKDRLDAPIGTRSRFPRLNIDQEKFGRASEAFARAMGTGGFLIGMTVFCVIWLAWNTFAPETIQFDPRLTNFTLLTLILSMQASYAAPLILLAQNRTLRTPSTSLVRLLRFVWLWKKWLPKISSKTSFAI